MKYFELFLTFFKIGLFTFGGGYAMIPMIENEMVTNRGWITSDMLSKYFAISETTPGPFAINVATLIGNSQGGFLGAVVATIGVILPSFIIILIVYYFFNKFLKNKLVQYGMNGIKAVVIGLILSVVISFSLNTFNLTELNKVDYTAIIIFIFLMTLTYFKKFQNPIVIILSSAFLGLLVGIF